MNRKLYKHKILMKNGVCGVESETANSVPSLFSQFIISFTMFFFHSKMAWKPSKSSLSRDNALFFIFFPFLQRWDLKEIFLSNFLCRYGPGERQSLLLYYVLTALLIFFFIASVGIKFRICTKFWVKLFCVFYFLWSFLIHFFSTLFPILFM